ncbi:MAG: TetR/AcrR family transcriptional regulator [Micromonosporaceae bacterium]|nr:TetR/AcrR family transcriptional regulator [Micromonosporaceae bacterium]
MTTPSGLARRHRRLSDRETRDRLLHAATEMINETGLTVSLEHISFEDVIRAADVARSTAYRHWPYKDLFFKDLVRQLASGAELMIIQDETELARRVLDEHRDWLATPALRHRLMLELIRQLSALDFRSVLGSARWRTYLALHAACASLTDDDLRAELAATLAQTEATRTAHIAEAWRQAARVFGYRLRPELGSSFEAFATLLNASLRGLVITGLSDVDIATRPVLAAPFGSDVKQEWSPMALATGSLAMTFLEPDPDAGWNEQSLAGIHRLLDAWRTGPPAGDDDASTME